MNIESISNLYKNWRNKREEKRIKNKFLGLYVESVGQYYFSDNTFGEGRPNKERNVKPLWNRKEKKKSPYEVMKKTLS
jgi:hypothetical protein